MNRTLRCILASCRARLLRQSQCRSCRCRSGPGIAQEGGDRECEGGVAGFRVWGAQGVKGSNPSHGGRRASGVIACGEMLLLECLTSESTQGFEEGRAWCVQGCSPGGRGGPAARTTTAIRRTPRSREAAAEPCLPIPLQTGRPGEAVPVPRSTRVSGDGKRWALSARRASWDGFLSAQTVRRDDPSRWDFPQEPRGRGAMHTMRGKNT